MWVSLVIVGLLFELELRVGSLMVGVGLFELGRMLGSVGWWLWMAWMVMGMVVVGLGWHVGVSLVVVGLLFEMELGLVSLMVGVGLVKLGYRMVAVGWQL